MHLTALALERGEPKLPPHPRLIGRIFLYAPGTRAVETVEAIDSAISAARSRFESTAPELRALWESVRIEAGRTKGYRFVYLVLRSRGVVLDQDAIVAAVTFTPAEPVVGSIVEVCADVSGEETGTLHFGPLQRLSPIDGLREAAVHAADDVLGWLRNLTAAGSR